MVSYLVTGYHGRLALRRIRSYTAIKISTDYTTYLSDATLRCSSLPPWMMLCFVCVVFTMSMCLCRYAGLCPPQLKQQVAQVGAELAELKACNANAEETMQNILGPWKEMLDRTLRTLNTSFEQ